VGRRKINFDTASERTKRMKTQNVRAKRSSDELCYAVQISLQASDETDAVESVK